MESYCGSEADAVVVKRKTAEEFYFWLERKVKQAKKIEAESQKIKVKSRKT